MLLWRDYECHHRDHEQTVSDRRTAAKQTVHATSGHYYTLYTAELVELSHLAHYL